MWWALSPGEPLGADKLPVGYQAVNLVVTHHLKESTHQRDAFPGIGIAPFGQDLPQERKSDAVMDNGQDEEVDRSLSKHPLSSIQSQGVRGIGVGKRARMMPGEQVGVGRHCT